MKAICIKEPTVIDGVKTLEFTKDNVYNFAKDDKGNFVTLDDNGYLETFFDITKLFKIIE